MEHLISSTQSFSYKMDRQSYDMQFKLNVLKYAKENSGEAAARHFKVSPSTIRGWKKKIVEIESLTNIQHGLKRKRLSGAGAKIISEEMEMELMEWILEERSKHNRVSREMIRRKAIEIFSSNEDNSPNQFKASRGWLEKFLRRNDLSLIRKKTSQKNSDQMGIVAMDSKRDVWFDVVDDAQSV
uniref:HTH CENPB-type domain-containing protein n=1 Tax=Strigamia maritima TaxID=126957 RepID=T1IKN1_STRMM